MKDKMRSSLTWKLALYVFLCLFSAGIFTICIYFLASLIFPNLNRFGPMFYIISSLIFSLIIGTVIAGATSKKVVKELNIITKSLNEIASGNFNVKLAPARNVVLNQIVTDFNKMVEQLGSVNTLQNDFITNFSHEFKTPIVSINGFAELLIEKELPVEEQHEYLQIIADESARLAALANNTLLMSRLDNQTSIPNKMTYLLDEQIRQCVLLFEKELQTKKITVRVKLDKMIYYGNETLIQQVWINLLANAIKFTNNNGKITINSTVTDEDFIISVSDNGTGIDENNIQYIFNKYYQGDSSRQMVGNGLGLSIVKRIIELSDGSISVTSKIDKGTTFTITLKKNCSIN